LTERLTDPPDLPPFICEDCNKQVTLGGIDYDWPYEMCRCIGSVEEAYGFQVNVYREDTH